MYTPAYALMNPTGKKVPQSTATADYCYQRFSDTTSNLWLAHSNRMVIGRPFWYTQMPDDSELNDSLPYTFKAVFPADTRKEYLYAAGLWVGGIKDNDTIVAHGFEFDNAFMEIIPPPCPEGAMQNGPGLADMEHISVGYDTIIAVDTLLRLWAEDTNNWDPLGIKVTSHSYTWTSPPFDQSVIVQYTIKNIDAQPITDGYVGFYADCDVGVFGSGAGDDISGFLQGAFDSTGQWVDLNIAYTLDMDGDPGQFGFEELSANGIFGIQIIDLSTADYRVNFNWWVSPLGSLGDWGPRQLDDNFRDYGDSYNVPRGDSNKYYIMAYPEVDYNQIESGLPHYGWVNPSPEIAQLAFGRDTRFVVSAGPFDLQPGEEVTLTMAYVAGADAIRNPYIDSWLNPSDPLSVSDYYELLNTSDLVKSAMAARAVFENGFDFPPPGPPNGFALAEYDDSYAEFVWHKSLQTDVRSYAVLQLDDSGEWAPIAELDISDTTIVLTDLDPDSAYVIAIAAIDSGGHTGKPSPEIRVITGRPHAPDFVDGISNKAYPILHWSRGSDPDIDFYRVYRVEIDDADTMLLAETTDTTYTDFSAAVAVPYEYYITSFGDNGNESNPSMAVRLVPMLLNRGILAINQNVTALTSNLAFTPALFDEFMATGMGDIGYTAIDYDEYNRPTIEDLSRYSLVILSSENLFGSILDSMEHVLDDYMANGGKVIYMLRYAAVHHNAVTGSQKIRYVPTSFMSRRLYVDSSYIGPVIIQSGESNRLIGDLIGADPLDATLPALTWDSLKINQFYFDIDYGIPYAGYFWPHDTVDAIYTYRSNNPDSTTHGHINGIRYHDELSSFYLLAFPVSLMQADSAAALLQTMIQELGEEFICGDINGDYRLNLADASAYIQYLYNDYHPVALERAGDLDCDGEYTLGDLQTMLNFFYYHGLAPKCCE